MNKELNKFFEKRAEQYSKSFECNLKNGYGPKQHFSKGLQAAIESELVQGLVEALEFYKDRGVFEQGHGLEFQEIAIEALKKFRGE